MQTPFHFWLEFYLEQMKRQPNLIWFLGLAAACIKQGLSFLVRFCRAKKIVSFSGFFSHRHIKRYKYTYSLPFIIALSSAHLSLSRKLSQKPKPFARLSPLLLTTYFFNLRDFGALILKRAHLKVAGHPPTPSFCPVSFASLCVSKFKAVSKNELRGKKWR